jgi:hypothetical protein
LEHDHIKVDFESLEDTEHTSFYDNTVGMRDSNRFIPRGEYLSRKGWDMREHLILFEKYENCFDARNK